MKRHFQIVDVFGSDSLSGNPVAVVLDSAGLSTAQMQDFTRWMNLSETTFVSPPTDPGADYAVRIFTLARELPFAGHPTLGTCHAWLDHSGDRAAGGTTVQECGAGLVPVRNQGGLLGFSAPPLIRSGPVEPGSLDDIARVLGIARGDIVEASWVDNGPGWVGILLSDAAGVLALEPDFGRRDGSEPLHIGVIGPHPEGSETDFEVRAFFSDQRGNMIEDPVTGSLNASLAQWMLASARAGTPYRTSQGTMVGRAGRVELETGDDGTLWVSGKTVTIVEGAVDL